MFRRKFVPFGFFTFFCLVAFCATSASAAPATDDAELEVKSAVEQIRDIVAKEKAKLTTEQLESRLHDVLMPIFDFDTMSRSSLGANWKRATPDQQKEFVRLFSKLLGDSYLTRIRRNIEEREIEFLPSKMLGERVLVRSKIVSDGDLISAEYRMHQKDGKWRIYDVVVENVGLVTNYRSEFSSILERNDSFDALLQKLRDQTLATKAP